MSEGMPAVGTKLKVGDGATPPENFTAVAEAVNFDGPDFKASKVGLTSHDSPNGYEESKPGFKQPGVLNLELNYIPDDPTQDAVTGIISTYETRAVRNYKLVFPNPALTTLNFAGWVSGWKPGAPVEGKLALSVSIELTGAPTWSVGG